MSHYLLCTADWSLSSHILFIIMLSVPLYSSPPDHLRVLENFRNHFFAKFHFESFRKIQIKKKFESGLRDEPKFMFTHVIQKI